MPQDRETLKRILKSMLQTSTRGILLEDRRKIDKEALRRLVSHLQDFIRGGEDLELTDAEIEEIVFLGIETPDL